MTNDLKLEVNVCFVDIDGIVDHLCLNFLYIIPDLLLYYSNLPCIKPHLLQKGWPFLKKTIYQ